MSHLSPDKGFISINKFFLILLCFVFTCASLGLVQAQETGTLHVHINGEDLVREGFESKDGWQLKFDQVLVQLTNIRAYQTEPAYNADQELTQANLMVGLSGLHRVDLTSTSLLDSLQVPSGYYNAISWQLTANSHPSMVIAGQARHADSVVDFSINLWESVHFNCGTYIGDTRKGIVSAGADAEIEMTLHMDHLFGDASLPADDALNVAALGFSAFASAATDGLVSLAINDLDSAVYSQFMNDILPQLGHVGEGHCYAVQYD